MISAKAIRARLIADTAVNAEINGRMWPKPAPQAASNYPRLVYSGENASTGQTYEGTDGLGSQKVTISCEAMDYPTAAGLADKVRASLDGVRGTFGGVVVQGCFYEDERDEQYEEGPEGEQRLIFATEVDFTIWFNT